MIVITIKNIGEAPQYRIALIGAINVIEGQITSVFSETPAILRAKCSAEDPEFVKVTYFDFVKFFIFFLNLLK